MPFFQRFGKRWAATGTIAEPTDNQSDAGFAFLGNNAPSVELFNSIFRMQDEKDNWLYARITEVLAAGGVSPSEATPNQLLTALRTLFAPGIEVFEASRGFIVPPGVTRIKGRVWGGGGGGGNAQANGAGTGGAGGGYAEGVYTVTPGSSIFVTVGVGGNGQAVNGSSAQPGGSSSIGSLCSASGGTGGIGSSGGISSGNILGGIGLGGAINLRGQYGGFGQVYPGGNMGGGVGGSSPFGGGLSHISIAGIGNPGEFPGGGACGAGGSATSAFSGGRGANGLVIIEWG